MGRRRERIRQLERRLSQLEDREAIRELIACTGFTADLGYDEEYASLYTDGAVYDTGSTVHRGAAELFDLVADPDGVHRRVLQAKGSQHLYGNLVVQVDGDAAWAECYSIVVIRADEASDAFAVCSAGYNHWDFHRIEGRWQITARSRSGVGDSVHRSGAAAGRDTMTAFPGRLPR